MDEQTEPRERRPDAALVEGLRPELLAALVLRRALRGGVAQAGSVYVDRGYRMGYYLIGTFTELIEDGLLALTEENCGLRRVMVTDAGRARYAQVCGILRPNRR